MTSKTPSKPISYCALGLLTLESSPAIRRLRHLDGKDTIDEMFMRHSATLFFPTDEKYCSEDDHAVSPDFPQS